MKKFLSSAGRGSHALFAKSIFLLTVLCSVGVWGQISIATLPYTKSDNFDAYNPTNASNATTTLPSGWTLSSTSTTYNGKGNGVSATGGFWGYGTSDYSLGALRSSTNNYTYSVSFTNNSGSSITSLTIAWSYEQWRFANTSGWDVSGTGQLAGNTTLNGKDFSGVASGTNGAVASTPISSFTLTGLNITDGQTFGLSWITTDATSADNGVSIDDFYITANGTSTPTITVSSAITGLDYIAGSGPSAPKSFTVSGANLTSNINVAAPANFEISTALNGTYTSSLTLTPTSGTVASTTLYARLASGLAVGSYSGNITASSTGATNKTIAVSGAVSRATITSTQTGSWSQASTWSGGVVPTSSDNAVIATGHVVTMDSSTFATRDLGTTTTVNSGGTLATAVNYINNGSTTVNGSFQLDPGGWVSDAAGTNPLVYGSNGTLIFNNTYTANSGNYWPTTNGPVNVTVNPSSQLTLGFNRTVAGTFQTASGVLFPGNTLTLNGIAQINTYGWFGNSPIYGSGSTLVYNASNLINGSYGKASEWTQGAGTIGVTPGYPQNVQLSNNTILDYPNGSTTGIYKANGNLTVDANSALYQDFGSKNAGLIVGGNVTLNGYLSLGSATGGDLTVGGNWSQAATSTFTPNNRAVFFNGTTNQTITGATTFDYLTVNNPAGVTLASPVTNNLTLDFANGKLTLGNNDLTIGSGGTITNATFTKYVVTNGSGRLKRTVSGTNVSFPVGNSAYNPVTLNNSGSSDIYGIRVADLTPAGANPAKTVNRQWITTEEVPGGSNLQVVTQYNAGETGSGFSTASDPFIGLYSGTGYTQVVAKLAGSNPFTASSNANFTPSDLSGGTQYFAVGKDNGLVSVPAKYVVSNITPASPVAGQSFSATVTAQDAYNTASLLPSGSAFILSTNGNAGPISGSVSGTIASGSNSVVVSGIMLPDPGTGVTITSTNTGGAPLSAGTSAPFTVVGVATQLKFVNVPASGTAGSNLPVFTVEARRADNSVDTNFTGNITITKASGPGTISGTLTKAAVAGVATFNNIQFDAAGTYTITTASGTLTNDMSGNIVIVPNPANAYFRSKGTGNWSAPGSWESSSDGITWANATVAPTSAANVITVGNGHAIEIDSDVTLDQLSIESNGTLSLNINSGKLNISDGAGIDIDVKSGGILQVFSTGSASNITYSDKIIFSGNAAMNVSGTILVGNGSNFMGGGYGEFGFASAAQIIWNNESVLEWNTTGSVPAFANKTYFPGVAAGVIPTLKITKINGGNVGGGPTIIEGLLELNGVTVLWEGSGTKVFRNGISAVGTAAMTRAADSGSWQIGDGTAGNAEIGGPAGNLTLSNSSGISISPLCYAKLTSAVKLDMNTKFTVKSGATLDFGFDSSDVALNIIRNGTTSGQTFTAEAGSTLIITSPEGIVAGNTTPAPDLYKGNVQVGATSAARVFNPIATYHYIGKSNQVTGNGLPKAASDKKVIVELAQDNLEFRSSNGIIRFNNPSTATGPNFRGLEIRKGTVISDNDGNRFEDSSVTGEVGNLKMTGGILKLFAKDIQPSLKGVYELSAPSKIDFALTHIADTQSISGGSGYIYSAIEVSGKSVQHTSGNINMKSAGSFTVKDGGLLSSQGSTGQINSNDESSKATFIVENNGTFATQREKGFYGPVSGGSPAPSVKDNMLLSLNPNSTVDYSRFGDQVITSQILGTVPNEYSYQNLRISGGGVKTATGTITVNNRTFVDAGTLEIPATPDAILPNVITSKKGISVQAGGTFNLNNNAQLLQDADAVNSGSITARREISVKDNNQYNYLISPLIGSNLKTNVYENQMTGALSSSEYTLYHNEQNNKFFTSTGAYILGRGLAVKEPAASTAAPGGKINAYFTGVPMNGAFIYQLANSGTAATGYNLIGNPYPSNIDLDLLYNLKTNKDKISATFYFWDNTVNTKTAQEGSGYDGAAYAVFNAAAGSTGTGLAAGNLVGEINGSKEPTRTVKPGQGFMVRSLSITNKSIDFDNSIRLPDHGNVFFGKESAVDDRFYLKLSAPNNITTQTAVVYFGEGNSAFAADDSELNGAPSDVIYTIVGDKKVIINGREPFTDIDVIPLGARYFASGLHTIAVEKKEGIFGTQPIYLKDSQTGIITNLSDSGYTFMAQAGESTGRFEITYRPGSVLATDTSVKQSVVVYRDQNNFHVKSPDRKITALQLFDSSGRMICSALPNLSEAVIDGSTLPNGTYIIKVNCEGEIFTRKVVR